MAKISTKNATQALGYRMRDLPHFIHTEFEKALDDANINRETVARLWKRVDMELVLPRTVNPIRAVLQRYTCLVTHEDITDIAVIWYWDRHAQTVKMERNGQPWLATMRTANMEGGQPAHA